MPQISPSTVEAPQSAPLVLSPNETHPNAKALASRVALAVTTYEPHESVSDLAARLDFADPQAAAQMAALFHVPGSWSRGRIVYPQLGGLTDDRVSVMVVVEQMIGLPDGVLVASRTLDVRLALSGGSWRFERLASAGGTPLPPPQTLSPEAQAVLSDPRIEMPDSARWDIYSGLISPSLLAVMARLADIAPYGVVTLSEGHPYEVFGTPRQSDHSRGRAVDIYRVGDRLVIDDRAQGSLTYRVVEWALAQPEIRQVGSPWRFEGPPGRSFTDRLHLDHLHIAVQQ